MSIDTERRRGYLRQAWLVILLGLIYGAALAGVQTGLGPRIEENKRREIYGAIPKLVPGADRQGIEPITVTDLTGKSRRVFRVADSEGNLRGWAIPARGLGFAGRIELLVGLDPAMERITGMDVIAQTETPGLGSLIDEPSFREQFAGTSAREPIEVVKTEPKPESNQVRAVTAATISSVSVANIVNRAVERLRGPILERRPGR